MRLCLGIIAVLLAAQQVSAQQVGDTVIVFRGETPLVRDGKTVATIKRGSSLVVLKAEGQSLEVSHGGTTGWIDASNVATVDTAIEKFTEAIQQNPDAAFLWALRAGCWELKGEIENTLVDIDQAIHLNQNEHSFFEMRGSLFARQGKHDKAIADFDTAVRLAPAGFSGYLRRAVEWTHQKQFDKAIEDYDAVIRLKPDYRDAFAGRGNTYFQLRKFDKAIEDANSAIAIDSQYGHAFAVRGLANFYATNRSEALSDLNHAVSLGHQDSNCHLVLAGLYWSTSNEQRAIEEYRAAVRLNPATVGGHLGLAMTLSYCVDGKLKDNKLAIQSAQKACELTEWNDANSIWALALTYASTGDFDEAIKWQTKAIELAPANKREMFETALRSFKLGKIPQRKSSSGGNTSIGLEDNRGVFR